MKNGFHWLVSSPVGFDVGMVLALLFLTLIYFVPLFLCLSLHCPHPFWVAAINALLGWTVLVWIALLIWSLSRSSDTDTFDDTPRIPPRF